ncbi:YkyB family protein [Paraliobacillus sp. X-1268]|uniref:YkyB family protein n=1 Tax=Paraliobacillus sp. X-1268 TaxID=2213193 RepID=UPI000E3D2989|nr:YkyB family protein [Paraliobacillus sp. X-1268]
MKKEKSTNIEEIAKALFIINRHAKTALNPSDLYNLKKKTITKLLENKNAEKIGLHFSDRPKLSRQHSTLLVKVGSYYFHIPPNKQDFKEVEHLGNIDQNYRNPKTKLSLTQAKKVLYVFLEIPYPVEEKTCSAYYTPSSLGRWNQSYFKNRRER